MLGILTDLQIDEVLHTQMVGRIGCSTREKIYVVPVTYAYRDGYIYVHSKEGMKILMMREHPEVCFQVDAIDSMTSWRSVVIWGTYEELKTPDEQTAGMKVLGDRLAPFNISQTVRPSAMHPHFPEVVEKERKAVAYRIKVTQKSGRFEKSSG